jgi:hypothetical protein
MRRGASILQTASIARVVWSTGTGDPSEHVPQWRCAICRVATGTGTLFVGASASFQQNFMKDPSAPRGHAEIRRAQPDGAVLFCGTNLRVRVVVLKPGVVLASAHGEVVDAEDASAETALLAEFERELERAGTLTLFADLRASPRMPAASREKIAQWTRRHQARILPSHILVRSKLIEMALSIITMLVGGGLFKIHTKPQTFLDLVKNVAPKLSELPSVPEE